MSLLVVFGPIAVLLLVGVLLRVALSAIGFTPAAVIGGLVVGVLVGGVSYFQLFADGVVS